MALDPDAILQTPAIEMRQRLTPEAVMLYALSVGAIDLPFVYEKGLKALPTLAAIQCLPQRLFADPRNGVTMDKAVHGEVSLTLHAPLPVEGELIRTARAGPLFDKGIDKGAVLYISTEVHAADGTHLATVRNALFLRANGGFGGSAEGQLRPHAVPDRPPDFVEEIATRPDQAMLYRLASGDMTPFHIDPEAAGKAGFERPILHGLASFGMAARVAMRALAGDDPARMRRIDARFSAPLFPGETILVSIWREDEGRAAFRCHAAERDRLVIDHGYVEFAP